MAVSAFYSDRHSPSKDVKGQCNRHQPRLPSGRLTKPPTVSGSAPPHRGKPILQDAPRFVNAQSCAAFPASERARVIAQPRRARRLHICFPVLPYPPRPLRLRLVGGDGVRNAPTQGFPLRGKLSAEPTDEGNSAPRVKSVTPFLSRVRMNALHSVSGESRKLHVRFFILPIKSETMFRICEGETGKWMRRRRACAATERSAPVSTRNAVTPQRKHAGLGSRIR